MVTTSFNLVQPSNVLNVAHYSYQFSRDGGAVGPIQLDGPSIPEGALLVAVVARAGSDLAFDTDGFLEGNFDGHAIDNPDPGLGTVTWLPLQAYLETHPQDSPPLWHIGTAPCTAGTCDFWVLYVV